MAITALMAAPVTVSMPKMTLKPMPAPAMLPILKPRPPMTISAATTYPKPGRTILATSWPRFPEMPMTRHTLSCEPISKIIDVKMTKPKLASSCSVNTVVCVKNPGPIDDVAIRKAAPISTLKSNPFLVFILSPLPPSSQDTLTGV